MLRSRVWAVCGFCYHTPNASSSLIPMLVSMPWLALLSSGILRWKARKRRCCTHSSAFHSRITDFITGGLGLLLKLIALHESLQLSSLITPAWHPGAFERLFVLLFDRGNLWEGELFAVRGWWGKFSLAAHLNWVCWCLPCTKTSNLIWSAWLHRWFEVGFIQPWELSPPMKGTVCEPSGLWQPGTPNWNGCVGKGWAADPQSS